MTGEKLDEKAIFNVARTIPSPEARAEFLRQACSSDAELIERVQTLLRGYEQQASFLESSPAAIDGGGTALFDQSIAEQPGTVIGPYKLLEQIGEGGFGVVFMAEQMAPVRRKVALKIIKPGMDTKQVIARFEAERQALALMDHPNIARVFDGGATESGRPYFVMELVHGVQITEYCNLQKLTPPERLRLFIDVCRPVQHAHQKGIIHRDLKSSNVMVTMHDDKPVPKIIDFGVSKAISHQLTEKTLFTAYGQMVGTPMYMSPEQAQLSGLDVDTRSDVYSLGVLLYELTTGTTPFDEATFRRVGFDEMRRMIREEEPLCPSARINTLNADQLSTIADQRNVDPHKLRHLLHGEVDWIVMKCLEKDRNRRYETANALAQDIERSLADEPVLACPPSATYRLRKFARRNKRALAAAILMTTALLLVLGSIAWTLRDRAARQFLLEQQVTRALVETEDSYKRDRMPEARATMNRADGLLASGGGGNKRLRDRVRRWRSDLDMAVQLEEIRLNKADVKDESFDGAGATLAYREAFRDYGLDIDKLDVDEAAEGIKASAVKAHLLAALDEWLGSVETKDPTWNKLLTVARLADSDPWRNRFRVAQEEARHRGDVSPVVRLARDTEVLNQPAVSLHLLGTVLLANRENSLAVELLRQSQQRRPDDFWINHDLAQALEKMNPPQTDEAVEFFRVAVALRPESPGPILNLGRALAKQGKMDEAIAAYRRAIDLKPDYATPYNNLGVALLDQNKLEDAAAMHRKAVSLRPDLAAGHLHLGCVLQRQGKLDEAIVELRRAIELQPDSAAAYNHLGLALSEGGKLDEGISALRKAVELQPDCEGYNGLGMALAVQGKLDEAITALRKAIELKPDDASAYQGLGIVFVAQGNLDEAIAAFRKAIELKPDDANGYYCLGTTLQNHGKLDEAIAALRKAIELQPDFAEAYNNLGLALRGQGKPDEAIAAFYKAIELKPELKSDLAFAYGNLGHALRDQHKWDEAATAYRKAIELKPDYARVYNDLGAILRDQGKWNEALELATKAVALGPQDSMNWQALGCAYYRTGDWQASIEALEKSCKLHDNGIGNAFQWLFLAMAHWQLGHHEEARTWYDKGVQNEKIWPDELRRFRTEAEELLGLNEKENKSSVTQ